MRRGEKQMLNRCEKIGIIEGSCFIVSGIHSCAPRKHMRLFITRLIDLSGCNNLKDNFK